MTVFYSKNCPHSHHSFTVRIRSINMEQTWQQPLSIDQSEKAGTLQTVLDTLHEQLSDNPPNPTLVPVGDYRRHDLICLYFSKTHVL